MPQNDVLGHPRTKAFLSHGGVNGLYEVRRLHLQTSIKCLTVYYLEQAESTESRQHVGGWLLVRDSIFKCGGA